MEIHQVVVSASPGDAVTNSALELRSLLRHTGRSDIYAENIHPRLQDDVIHISGFATHSPKLTEDVILFHASIGAPEVFNFIRRRPERVCVIYHNISPAEYFYPYDPAFAGLLEGGRMELRLLRDRSVMTLADSRFNAEELREMSYRDVRVSPLIVDAARLRSMDPHEATSAMLDSIEGPKLLFVGQLLPHKRPDLLVKAFHILSTYIQPEAHLFLVGADRLPAYGTALEQLVAELNLTNVHLVGTVSDRRLASFYRGCDVFVTASEHEGFCIPLLEAMAFEMPIIARNHAAVPETLGDAGILLDETSGALILAEAMAEMVANDGLRRSLAERGTRRLAEFDPERSRGTFLSHMLDLVR